MNANGVPTAGAVQLGTVNTLNHPFEPVPFGFDLYAEFGNERALPLVGNFDPPVTPDATTATTGDFDSDGDTDGADLLAWQRGLGRTGAPLSAGDANGDGVVGAGDLSMWKSGFAAAAATAGMSGNFDGDADVDGADLLKWQRGTVASATLTQWKGNFGRTRRRAPRRWRRRALAR